MLAATAQVPSTFLARFALAGELPLKGELMPTPGILSVAIAAARAGLAGVVVLAPSALRSRPFRAPHHSISIADLLGGGTGYLGRARSPSPMRAISSPTWHRAPVP